MTPLLLFKALADDTRLRLLLLLQQQGELCVCELMMALGQSQPKISRHLALLRRTGLLADRRQGQWVFYRIDESLPDWGTGILQQALHAAPEVVTSMATALMQMGNRPQRQRSCCELTCE
ncbi:transcriptional regulator [Shewanella sp. NFH-SH190041]|uniref:metalloregulator ArsR/SmtB family transcription factor n=1 Tax=Shewanella sp. NFH-SH190041 TaxID=2950245 RepID=UPI0021C29FC2|nr:metalloregulator ArsR/SmtB family transcription factor [Shewanella sp. NFH-SH190041]BDM63127.1 transcriptional regulator [Shewanella sp. NFH-SH190041]